MGAGPTILVNLLFDRRGNEGLVEQCDAPWRDPQLLKQLRRRLEANLAVVTQTSNEALRKDAASLLGNRRPLVRILGEEPNKSLHRIRCDHPSDNVSSRTPTV